jgi:hypothetical protein
MKCLNSSKGEIQMSHNAHLEITTRIGCKVNCKFCPQDKLLKNYKSLTKVLSFRSFKRFLDKVPKEVDIHFSGMAEPFLNKDCLKMINYARQNEHNVSVFTTTIGLDIKTYEKMLDIEFDMFCVHIADNNNLTNIKVDDEYIELIDFISKNKPNCKKFWWQCHGQTHESLNGIIDFNVDRYMIDRAGNVENEVFNKIDIDGRFICTAVGKNLNQNILLPNGDVVLCCMDYELKHILGNLKRDSYVDLLMSNEANNVRFSMDGMCKSLCNKCSRAKEVRS